MSNRRDFLKKSTLLGLSGLASTALGTTINQAEKISTALSGEKILLPALPYAYNALEPYIDRQTMEIHHSKHHQAYIDKLNTVPPAEFDAGSDLAMSCKKVSAQATALHRNNLGGHYNHTLFWTLMYPNADNKINNPTGKLAEAINQKYGGFYNFSKEFSEKALKIFGSGWCWLILKSNNELSITTTANQDNPLMQVVSENGKPILALDVWEHAYYLKYQNKRADYISGWWNVVNWKKAEELFNA